MYLVAVIQDRLMFARILPFFVTSLRVLTFTIQSTADVEEDVMACCACDLVVNFLISHNGEKFCHFIFCRWWDVVSACVTVAVF